MTAFLSWFDSDVDIDPLVRAAIFLRKGVAIAHLWFITIHPFEDNQRQQRILNRLLNNFQGPMTTSKYAKIAKCSTDTALRDIRSLVTKGLLIQNASGGRSTSYRLPDIADI